MHIAGRWVSLAMANTIFILWAVAVAPEACEMSAAPAASAWPNLFDDRRPCSHY